MAPRGAADVPVVCALLHDIGDTLGSMNHANRPALSLELFEPMVRHVFGQPKNSICLAAME